MSVNNCCSVNANSTVGDPPAGLPLNSADGDMWLSMNLLFSSNNFHADSLNYQLAMKSINRFFALYPASGPAPTDDYLHRLWSDLQMTTVDDGGKSLYTLASDYASSGYSSTDFNTFSTMISNINNPHIPLSVMKNFMGDLNQFGSREGSYMSYAQTLTKRELQNLQSDFPLTASNLSQFLSDIKSLTLATSNLDGCSQFLTDLIGLPLDQSAATPANTTLAYLANLGDTTDLQTYLNANPQLSNELQSMFGAVAGLEQF